MAFRLPPLQPMRAFEAVARNLSVKEAAEELTVTPSAVSHSLSLLEEWLNVELIKRSGRSIRLTPAGEALFERVSGALSKLAAGTAAIPGRSKEKLLRLGVVSSVAHQWLMSRLPRFTAKHPLTAITVETFQRSIDAPMDNVDAAIRFGEKDTVRQGWVLLSEQRLVPVCTPALAQRPLAEVLHGQPRIRVAAMNEDWEAWSQASGTELNEGRSLTVDSLQMGLELAASGFGVAIGRRPLIDDAIANGRLAPLMVPEAPSRLAMWLVLGDGVLERAEIRAFRHWILAEFGRDPVSGRFRAPELRRGKAA